jgi:voltage-gated potassium channel
MSDGEQHAPDGGESRHRRALHAVTAHVRPGSFPLLLAALAVNYVLNGIAAPSLVGAAVLAVLGAGLYVLSENRLTVWVGAVLLGAYLALVTGAWTPPPPTGRVLLDSVAVGYLLWVLTVVLREVFRPSTSERDAVVGALSGFLLILSAFMRMHGLIHALSPGNAYRADPPLIQRSELELVTVFQYFSTITLTTVGYGDIVPVTPAARLVAGLQAIIGQVYLAVVIATLVSRVAARRD